METSAADADPEMSADAYAIETLLARFIRYHPDRIDLSLDRMYRLLADLGNPHEALPPVIHVAGTNSKGSTTAFLAAALAASGLSVSAYTSPHLVRFAERYQMAGEIIADADLLALFEEIDARNAGQPITEFEITTAAAFLAMARAQTDILLLETGLGGRYDATNVVVRPAAVIITPIGFDHMDVLGSTLSAIAGEKAAIQKPGVPTIVATQPTDAANVIADAADAIGAPLHRRGVEWDLTATPEGGGRYSRGETEWSLPRPRLPGRHQLENAALAAACLDVCGFDGVTPETVATGIGHTHWPGRMQQLTRGALVEALPAGSELWLDSAHNPMAAEALADTLDELQRANHRPLHLVLAMRDDKDVGGFLAPLMRHITGLIAVPLPGDDGTRSTSDPVITLSNLGRHARTATSVADALSQIAARSAPVRVLVTGSHLLVGAALRANG